MTGTVSALISDSVSALASEMDSIAKELNARSAGRASGRIQFLGVSNRELYGNACKIAATANELLTCREAEETRRELHYTVQAELLRCQGELNIAISIMQERIGPIAPPVEPPSESSLSEVEDQIQFTQPCFTNTLAHWSGSDLEEAAHYAVESWSRDLAQLEERRVPDALLIAAGWLAPFLDALMTIDEASSECSFYVEDSDDDLPDDDGDSSSSCGEGESPIDRSELRLILERRLADALHREILVSCSRSDGIESVLPAEVWTLLEPLLADEETTAFIALKQELFDFFSILPQSAAALFSGYHEVKERMDAAFFEKLEGCSRPEQAAELARELFNDPAIAEFSPVVRLLLIPYFVRHCVENVQEFRPKAFQKALRQAFASLVAIGMRDVPASECAPLLAFLGDELTEATTLHLTKGVFENLLAFESRLGRDYTEALGLLLDELTLLDSLPESVTAPLYEQEGLETIPLVRAVSRLETLNSLVSFDLDLYVRNLSEVAKLLEAAESTISEEYRLLFARLMTTLAGDAFTKQQDETLNLFAAADQLKELGELLERIPLAYEGELVTIYISPPFDNASDRELAEHIARLRLLDLRRFIDPLLLDQVDARAIAGVMPEVREGVALYEISQPR